MKYLEYIYEVHNKHVQQHLKENTEHPEYSEFWASKRKFSVDALNDEDAFEKIHEKFPKEKGFVVSIRKS
jgi:hypothetical protein